MINLERFKDVHPQWETIQNLDRDEAKATLELIELGAYLDDQISKDEVEVLTEQWLELPHVQPPPDASGIFDRLIDSYEMIEEMRDEPDIFQEYLDDAAEVLSDEDVRYAVFRLVAIVASADGFEDSELDYCAALGITFGFDADTIDEILRSVWSSHETASDEDLGIHRRIPRITRENKSKKRRTVRNALNPFASRF